MVAKCRNFLSFLASFVKPSCICVFKCSAGDGAILTVASLQGTQKVQTAYFNIDTDAQAYVASMLEVHHESRQLRANLRKQHRIWMDFYATIFRVQPLCFGLFTMLLSLSWLDVKEAVELKHRPCSAT